MEFSGRIENLTNRNIEDSAFLHPVFPFMDVKKAENRKNILQIQKLLLSLRLV